MKPLKRFEYFAIIVHGREDKKKAKEMGIVQISVALKLFLLEMLVLFKAVNSLMYLQSEVSAFLLFFQDL